MDVIFLCGAGGTGKSSVVREMSNLLAENKWPQFPLKVMPSTTRQTYARMGLKSETVALNSDIGLQVELQSEIMKDHLAEIVKCADEIVDTPNSVLVIDRSPLDHMAYWLRTAVKNPQAGLYDFYNMMSTIIDCLTNIGADRGLWALFPYPVPWSTDDGARDQNRLKTLEMQLLTEAILYQSGKILKKNKLVHVQKNAKPKARAMSLFHELEQWRLS